MKTELVTTLKRKATDLIAEVRAKHNFMLITEQGKPAAYLVDTDYFETVHNRMALLEKLLESENAIQEGKTTSHSEARKRFAKWLK